MRTFTLHFEERRPFTVTVEASSLAEARGLAKERLDTARERHADVRGGSSAARPPPC